jgi:hypothetical protein
MAAAVLEGFEKSRLRALLDHLAEIEDPREPWRVAHPLPEVLFLVVCGTICDCDDYDLIAEWGQTHLAFLRRYLPYHHGVPGGRWLTILMNRNRPRTCFRRLSRRMGYRISHHNPRKHNPLTRIRSPGHRPPESGTSKSMAPMRPAGTASAHLARCSCKEHHLGTLSVSGRVPEVTCVLLEHAL